MSTNIVKNQHFVPRFYLSRFLNKNNEAEILECKRRKIISPCGLKGICCEYFYYGIETGKQDEVSQAIERFFGVMEDSIAKVIPEFIDDIINSRQISSCQKWNVAALMSMLWVRGPAMRDAVKQMMCDGDFSLKYNNECHTRMFSYISGYANLFSAQHWTVYISNTSKKFVTSDNPVATYIPEHEGWYPPTFLEREHYFSLSPDICIKSRYASHKTGKNLVRKTLCEKDNDLVLRLNFQISNKAHQYTYSKNRRCLEDILTFIHAVENET